MNDQENTVIKRKIDDDEKDTIKIAKKIHFSDISNNKDTNKNTDLDQSIDV